MVEVKEKIKEPGEKLKQTIDELERFKNVIVGREMKMIELKDKIKRT